MRERQPRKPNEKNSLEYPSFTIEFLEHLLPDDYQHCLNQLKDTGASVEPHGEQAVAVADLVDHYSRIKLANDQFDEGKSYATKTIYIANGSSMFCVSS